MLEKCDKVCVIGAGTMGSGIAAHLANLGLEVTLLDLTADSARQSFDQAKQARPPHFYLATTADSIRLGSVRDNLEWAKEADWVCEAIIEKMDAKRSLFEQLDDILPPETMLTTNTSGLQIELLSAGRSAAFRSKFMGTHFFNPPRYLKLVELIPTPETDPEAVEAMSRFLEDRIARRVVVAKDTPGFIANRFGMWSMFFAIHVAEKLGLTIEETDAITGRFIGRPKSGSFRLNDMVGLDIMRDIADNLQARCPDDPYTKWLNNPSSLEHLLSKGWIGGKAGQGYYRREGREFLALDFQTTAYRMSLDVDFPSLKKLGRLPLAERLLQALELRDPVGEFLREYLVPTLKYADYLKEEVCHTVVDFDQVMKFGFGWEAGPFEMIDMIGPEKLGQQKKRYYVDGTALAFNGAYENIPKRPEHAVLTDFPVVKRFDGFDVRDLGDGVHAMGLTAKMGVLSPSTIGDMIAYLESGDAQRVVLASHERIFSAGFDLGFLLQCIEEDKLDAVEAGLQALQQLGRLLGQIPSAAAVFGFCLGGGCEMAISCSRVVATAESKLGFPESRVGLLPSGGGLALLRLRHQSSAKRLAEIAKLLALGTLSTSADNARKLGFMREDDVTVYLDDRLLHEAKIAALEAEPRKEQEWSAVLGPLSGMIESAQAQLLKSGELSAHDRLISDKIKAVLAKSTSFDDALEKERTGFISLLAEGLSQTRIRHMIETGKPLRN
ncbi:MAG: enoyl-CoA hydratase/isomerase family protein [Armatimonadetes bacterium]|nr:enoyl-CoA hydratase/isomerase family protein [Armatimonadota bacterium]